MSKSPTETKQKKTRHRRLGLGLSPRAFAVAIDTPLSQVRAMIEKKQVKTVAVGNVERIPLQEVERIRSEIGHISDLGNAV